MTSMTTKDLITNIILIILTIVFFVFLVIFIGVMKDNARSSYQRDASSYIYDIENGRYGGMVCDVAKNRVGGAKLTQDMKEVYAVADFFEAASLYKAYLDCNDIKSAEGYKQNMKEAAKGLGDFSYIEEEIKQKLAIE